MPRRGCARRWLRTGRRWSASAGRLRFHARLEDAVAEADFVQESGPERLDFKIDLFRRMDEAAPDRAILASSSSGLAISAVQAECRHPERVCWAIHSTRRT